VKKLLLSGGAKFLNYLSDNVTHLIGDNPDHHSVSEAVEIYEKPVVTVSYTLVYCPTFSLIQLFSESMGLVVGEGVDSTSVSTVHYSSVLLMDYFSEYLDFLRSRISSFQT
jgi:hypothetical protein